MKLGIFPEVQKFMEICNNYIKDGMSNSGKIKMEGLDKWLIYILPTAKKTPCSMVITRDIT